MGHSMGWQYGGSRRAGPAYRANDDGTARRPLRKMLVHWARVDLWLLKERHSLVGLFKLT